MHPHRTPAVLALLLLVALTGCGRSGPTARGGGPAGGGEAVELTRSGGCGEVSLWAATGDGTTVVTIGVDVPRYSTLDPVEIPLELPDPDVTATLLRGDADLTRNLCTDVVDAEAEPDETVPLQAGRGEVVIGTIPTDVSACGNVTATWELGGVVADDGTEIAPVSGETEHVGCFAG